MPNIVNIHVRVGGAKEAAAALGGVAAAATALTAGSGLLAMAGPLGAATAAIGAFAAVAIPAIHAVEKKGAVLTDQQKQLKSAVDAVKGTFKDLTEKMTPLIIAVVKLGGSFLQGLMPALNKLVPAGAKIIGDFLKPLTAMLATPVFKTFVDAMVKFGEQAGAVVGPQLVSLLKVFMRLFIDTMPTGIKLLNQLLPALVQMVRNLTPIVVVGAKVFEIIVKWLAANKLLVPALWLVVGALVAMKMALLTNPIVLIGAAIATLAFLIIKYHKQIWDFLVRIWNDVFTFIKRIWNDIYGFLKSLWDSILSFAKQWWPLLLGPGGLIVKYHNQIWAFIKRIWNDILNFFRNLWNTVWDAAKNIWGGIVSWFGGLPGRILHALGSLGGRLLHLGAAAMHALWNGLKSVASGILSWLSGLVGKVAGFFSHLLGLGGGAQHGAGPGGGGPAGSQAQQNAALARRMVPKWAGGAEWAAWNNVAMAESGWNQFAENASGAYGIPQALPPTKMPFAAQKAGGSDPGAQIGWMASYMAGRYGDPIGAWAFHQAHGWYAGGGPASGWVGVGDYGRELIKLPAGSQVYSNADSQRMMSAGGGPVRVVLEVRPGGQSAFDQFMAWWLRNFVRVNGQGSVQTAFGSR